MQHMIVLQRRYTMRVAHAVPNAGYTCNLHAASAQLASRVFMLPLDTCGLDESRCKLCSRQSASCCRETQQPPPHQLPSTYHIARCKLSDRNFNGLSCGHNVIGQSIVCPRVFMLRFLLSSGSRTCWQKQTHRNSGPTRMKSGSVNPD